MARSNDKDDKLLSSLTELYDLVENDEDNFEEEDSGLVQNLKAIEERYTDAEIIAQGGMKTISKVFDQKTARHIAMAQLHTNTPKELHEPFLREARLTALLDHPNIISIYNIGLNEEGLPFFTMELETGQSFKEVLDSIHQQNQALLANSLNQILESYLKICDAIAYAHSINVLHLDLKPDNIQTGDYGQITVCDWGLAKIIGQDQEDAEFDQMLLNPDLLNHMTLNNQVKGTPGFMAPEQVDSKSEVSKQTDIYALGAILYYALTGQSPIELEDSVDTVLDKTLQGKIASPDESSPTKSIPKALSAVCMKALATNPEERYTSVEELKSDLSNFMTGYSTQAQNAGFLTETQLFFKRNRTICLVILGALLIISATTAFFVKGLQDKTLEAQRAKEIAEENQTLAEKETERAEEILKLYKQEQESISSFIENHFKFLKDEVYLLTDNLIYENPEKAFDQALLTLNRMISSETKDLWPYMQRGYVHFLMQNLQKAHKDFSIHSNDARLQNQLTLKYLKHSKDDQLLNIDVFKKLLNEMKQNLKPQVTIMMLYDGQTRKSHQEHSQTVPIILQTFNPKWRTHGNFIYDSHNEFLKLSGQQLRKLTVSGRSFNLVKHPTKGSIPLLQTLKLQTLDIRGTSISKLEEFKGLKIESLDIRETQINEFSDIPKYLPKLKKLIVSPYQVRATDPIWQRKGLKIIIQ